MEGHLKLEVTKADIRGAQKCNPGNCPLARSFYRQFPNGDLRITVGRTTIAVFEKDPGDGRQIGFVRYEVPVEIERLINAFDRTGLMEPFEQSFRALAPSECGRTCEEVPNTGVYHLVTHG